ncbi:MAG TPA: RNA polymerase sigma factor [Planctomycetota bacterium]|nr:RNA polymerase sigma factor [Planctomycetota bacterium]
MTQLSEQEAVSRCQRGEDGDHAAFRVIYERYAAEVFRFQKRLLGDRHSAEDAVQDTFVRLHKGLKGYDASRPLRPYVFSVARNVAVDVLRVRAKRPRSEALPEVAAAITDDPVRNEQTSAVQESLASLAPEHRSLLVLRHVHGLKLEELAEGQACTDRTIRNRLRAAATLLERELRRRGVLSREVSP